MVYVSENWTASLLVAANSLLESSFCFIIKKDRILPSSRGQKTDPLHKKPGPMYLNKEAELGLPQGNILPQVP